jgi:hypothetical protein
MLPIRTGGAVGAAVFLLSVCIPVTGADASGANCSFQSHPDEFLLAESRAVQAVQQQALKLDRAMLMTMRAAGVQPVEPSSIPHRSFIDSEIFGKLAEMGVRPAPLSNDEEFLRRVTLDLTGRIPSPAAVREFLADADPDKRGALIAKLVASEAFTDKWTWWLGDLLQVNAAGTNVSRNINGRNAFQTWLRAKVSEGMSLREIAVQSVTASGNSYLMEEGATNFVINSITPGGPVQDQYDSMLSKTASTFLGLGYMDCLVCHNGRGHLDQLSLWGRTATRMEALRMAAFFSRQNLANHPESGNRESFFAGGRIVTDRATGNYALNTTNGNRPVRCAPGATVANNRCSATTTLDPEYMFTGAKPSGGASWRAAFAQQMVNDPMFARNLANRLWKEMFNLGLVDPVDTLDPARLDPNNPPPAPWDLQATHPVLLEKLAEELRRTDFNLREFLRLLAGSSAYQLSSRYSADWKVEYVPLFARHYPRRLEGEEIHDAIVTATGAVPAYTVQNLPGTVSWAMQLPDPLEPRSNGAVAAFMNVFLRGNRDSQQRSQSGSILQSLALMNDNFVLSRMKVAASPQLRAQAGNADVAAAVDELFLLFLGRKPVESERSQAVAALARASTAALRNTAVEDLAWVLVNKTEFLFSY